jgi:hypothetical protein
MQGPGRGHYDHLMSSGLYEELTAAFFARAGRSLFIEFVPKTDIPR